MMIYIAAVFFGCGLMRLLQYMWRNYTEIVMGAEISALVAGNEVANFFWSNSYLVLALVIVLTVSVPAVKQRDITYAGLHGLVFGGVTGLGLAALAVLGGNIGSVLEFGQILTLPVIISVFVALAGYIGGLLTCPDVVARLSRYRGMVVANDNEETRMPEGAILIEKVIAPRHYYVRIFDSSHRTLPGNGELHYTDTGPGAGAVSLGDSRASASA